MGCVLIKVLLVDDHDLVRMGMNRMLSDVADINVVGEASNGEDAIKLVKSLKPHVVLMDVQMPGIGGIEATRKLAQLFPQLGILVVTICEEEPFPSRILKAGALGYITKGTDFREMETAIRRVASGQRYLSADVASQLADNWLEKDKKTESPFELLSEREMQVAMMIVNCKSSQEIADSLFVSPKTISTYRYRIYEKLAIDSDVKLTHLAIRFGFVQGDKA
ncbi:LuxR family two component transcriptional regulator [Agitococcus lubricus]|uniref:LuxR family two component transcriptional regulator n=1 Tax=Agitococcus lubricus TaxID=1077255 RepID=A0A2T5IX39_9GAMM|nr:LuxR family two component transcriptional regulator [Agitococcus lubricus]